MKWRVILEPDSETGDKQAIGLYGFQSCLAALRQEKAKKKPWKILRKQFNFIYIRNR